jgi:hypothetical protein
MKICDDGHDPGAMATAARAIQAGHHVGILELARFQENIEKIRFNRSLRATIMISR